MADILPLRGIHYSPAAVGGDLSAVVAPPYDVISPDEQAALYARSPHNVVRLILGREDDKYARAAALFQDWLSEGILVADDTPSLYVYHQTFADPMTGEPAPERMGLICLLKLEEYASRRRPAPREHPHRRQGRPPGTAARHPRPVRVHLRPLQRPRPCRAKLPGRVRRPRARHGARGQRDRLQPLRRAHRRRGRGHGPARTAARQAHLHCRRPPPLRDRPELPPRVAGGPPGGRRKTCPSPPTTSSSP